MTLRSLAARALYGKVPLEVLDLLDAVELLGTACEWDVHESTDPGVRRFEIDVLNAFMALEKALQRETGKCQS